MTVSRNRTLRRYVQILETFVNFGRYSLEPMGEAVLESVGHVLSDTGRRQESELADSLDLYLMAILVIRGLLTAWVLWSVPSTAFELGLPACVALGLVFVRFPRFPASASVAGALVVFRLSPLVGSLMVVRLGFEVGRAIHVSSVDVIELAQNPRLVRASALARRERDRRVFFRALAEQTREASNLAQSEAWRRSRLTDEERGAVYGPAQLGAIAENPEGLAPAADAEAQPLQGRLVGLERVTNRQPQVAIETPGDSEDWLRSAPATSVGLEAIGELPLSPPPMIRVRSRSALLEHTTGRRRPGQVVDLEAAARAACGPDGYWLSYWSSGVNLFWALVPPSGDVQSGRIDITPESPAHEALRQLRAALPILLPDETSETMRRRVESGPLGSGGDRPGERSLSVLLGQSLIPRTVSELLRNQSARGQGPTPLAISPAAELANVPWPLLIVADGPSTPGGRLHDLADWRIAPTAALLDLISSRPFCRTAPPVRIAVLDPTGVDAPSGERSTRSRALLNARTAVDSLPPGAVSLTGRWDSWAHASIRSRQLATVSNLASTLDEIDEPSTMLVAAHCDSPSAESSAASGIAMAGEVAGMDDVLSAYDLLVGRTIGGRRIRFRFPERAIVAACDSAGASSVEFGEWLSFGPAALFAGSEVVVVTQFPIPDSSSVERDLIAELERDQALSAALRSVLGRHLADWVSGSSEPPLTWCGFALLGRWEGP